MSTTPTQPTVAEPAGSPRAHGLTRLFDLHAALLRENPYCYCEVAYTRQTGWMAWLCTDRYEDDSQRRVLGKGQGQTPNEAAAAAVASFRDGGPSANNDSRT